MISMMRRQQGEIDRVLEEEHYVSFPLLLQAALVEMRSLLLPLAVAALLLQAALAVLHSLLAKLLSLSKNYVLLQMCSGGSKIMK